jgi:hypothetical protein
VKSAVALGLLSAIILILAFWIVWPSAPPERGEQIMPFAHKSPPLSAVIDPPFGFHWGDSMAHVEAFLAYSSAEIVMRMATGQEETWAVEGLIQPGLKKALFVFDKNALTAIELQSQYEPWTADRYRTRIEELRAFFDSKYGEKRRNEPISNPKERDRGNQQGYSWRLGETNLAVFSHSELAPAGRRLSVTELIIRYSAAAAAPEPDSAIAPQELWGNTIVSPPVARKLQPAGDNPPAGSDLGITTAKLLNTSDGNQTAYALQLAVKLQQDAALDPARTVVEVNFYDNISTGELVLTDADVSYEWQSKRDRKATNAELLSVSYIRKPASSPQSSSPRKFFGYIATVYYDGRLECVRAEPIALINLFPVRTFVSPFENAQSAAGRGDFATAAGLYRRAAEQGNLFALENLAWFYARGKGVEKDYRQAAVFYERASLQNSARSLNALAWFLATCEDPSIRNGAEAVRHATKACELTYWQEWKYIDTLAAAWAENGDFKRAIEYEQQALGLKGLDEDTRKKMDDRVALYRKRQPVRE